MFEQAVESAASNGALNAALRFAISRWAELLDPQTHFSLSATALVNPTTAVKEFQSTAAEFLARGTIHYDTMLATIAATREALLLEPNTPTWYSNERRAVLNSLAAALQVPANAPPAVKRNWLTRRVRQVSQQVVAPFETTLLDPATGYRARLLGKVCNELQNAPNNLADWLRLDSDLAWLAAVAIAEGRDGRHLAIEFAGLLATAPDDAQGIAAFRAVLTQAPRRYQVALILHGARRVQNLGAFGFTLLGEPYSWPGVQYAGAAHERLQTFLARHLGTRRSCSFVVPVEAWDPEHARRLAVSSAERLHDQLVAEHRLTDFELNANASVIDLTTKRVSSLGGRSRSVEVARTLTPQGIPALERSLRFYALAKGERAPVVTVLHGWIAMEYLASGARVQLQTGGTKPQGPGAFLPPHLGAVMTLAATLNQLTGLWHLFRQLGRSSAVPATWNQLEAWLQVRPIGNMVDLDRWSRIVTKDPATLPPAPPNLQPTASDNQAASFLYNLAPTFGPFAERRLREIQSRFSDGRRLRNWGSRIFRMTQVQMQRIQRMRHQAVHRALIQDDAAHQLAEATCHILDAAYEVLPSYLTGGQEPWEALKVARDWHDQAMTTWEQMGAALRVDPRRMLHT